MDRKALLTLKDFWIPLKEKYPDALEHYCKWIDEMKIDLFWDSIFQQQVYPAKIPRHEYHTEYRTPKAHELLGFIQYGIFLQYIKETQGGYSSIEVKEDIAETIELFFSTKQNFYNGRI